MYVCMYIYTHTKGSGILVDIGKKKKKKKKKGLSSILAPCSLLPTPCSPPPLRHKRMHSYAAEYMLTC